MTPVLRYHNKHAFHPFFFANSVDSSSDTRCKLPTYYLFHSFGGPAVLDGNQEHK